MALSAVACQRRPSPVLLTVLLVMVMALYYGAASWADAIVGQIVAALRANGLLEDLLVELVVFDFGDKLGHGSIPP